MALNNIYKCKEELLKDMKLDLRNFSRIKEYCFQYLDQDLSVESKKIALPVRKTK